MKRLILMRHGEAEYAAATDKTRRLTPAGSRRAAEAGQELAAAGWAPQLILSSDATRAQETTAAVLGAFAAPKVIYEPQFYTQDHTIISRRILSVPEADQ